MNEREVIDLLDHSGDMSELIDTVDCLIDMIKLNPNKFTVNLRYALQDKLEEEECCPECGTPLEVIDKYYECRGEFWGQPAKEVTYRYGCINCGYIED
jgi:hypothetical protein